MATFRYIKKIHVYEAEHLISAHRLFRRTAFFFNKIYSAPALLGFVLMLRKSSDQNNGDLFFLM